MSALPPKADIGRRQLDVRFVPIADVSARNCLTILSKIITSLPLPRLLDVGHIG
jgi:hypothetical protein